MGDGTNGMKKKIEFMVNVAFVLTVMSLCFLAVKAAGILMPLVAAFVLVMVLSPVARLIHRKLGINRKLVSVTIMALLYLLIGWLIFIGVTALVGWLRVMFVQLPDYYTEVLSPALSEAIGFVNRWLADVAPSFAGLGGFSDSLMDGIKNLLLTASSRGVAMVTSFTASIPSFFVALIFTILLSFFISLQYDEVMAFIARQMPENASDKAKEIVALFKGTILRYFRALMILMTCTFVELSVGFLIIGVENPFGKALGIALFDALPVFGTGGIMIPWIIIELLRQNFRFAFYLLILYLVVTVVRNVIEPKIVSDQLGLNPILSVASVYLGYRLMGVVGMIFFPILAQVLVALHSNGTVKLWR